MLVKQGNNIIVSDNVSYRDSLTVGHCSVIGYGDTEGPVTIGKDATVGAFSIVENNVIIDFVPSSVELEKS